MFVESIQEYGLKEFVSFIDMLALVLFKINALRCSSKMKITLLENCFCSFSLINIVKYLSTFSCYDFKLCLFFKIDKPLGAFEMKYQFRDSAPIYRITIPQLTTWFYNNDHTLYLLEHGKLYLPST